MGKKNTLRRLLCLLVVCAMLLPYGGPGIPVAWRTVAAEQDPPAAEATVSDWAGLQAAIAAGQTSIAVEASISLEDTLYLTAETKLTGVGENITLSGKGTFALINAGANNITLENLTLTGGNSAVGGYAEGDVLHGGAICATTGGVTLKNCVLENNSATGNGGAVYTWTTVTATDTVFRNNQAAQQGGAILAAGEVSLEDCTFENNTASWFGGAIFAMASGVTSKNTDFTNNSATAEGGNGGAIHTDSGVITVTGGTFSGNTVPQGYGGALYSASGDITVENVTIRGGRALVGSAILADSGNVQATNVLLEDCVSNDGGFPMGSLQGTMTVDALQAAVSTLEELKAMLQWQIPKITVTKDIALTETLYPQGSVHLLGAGDGATLSGNGTFALINAEANSITLENLTLTGGNSAVGGYAEGDVLHGGAICATNGGITLKNCVLENNSATGNGGAVYTWTTVTATDTVFRNNQAAQEGGAILAAGEVTLEGCTFENNTASWFGGAIFTIAGGVTSNNTNFTNNSATAEGGNGGAIHTDSGAITVTGGTFSGNTAPKGYGGTLYSGSGTVTVEGAAISGGRAIAGAAIYTESGDIYVSGTLLDDCASSDGGAPVVSSSGTVHMDVEVTTFAELYGAIRSQIPVIRIAKDIVLEETIYTRAPVQLIGAEGGVTLSGNGTFALIHTGENSITLENLTLTGGNSAVGGHAEGEVLHGGAICATTGGVTLKNCVLENNSATGDGGAVYTWTTVTATGTTFRNNRSAQQGGAILAAGEVTLEDCVFENNTASWFGGAIYGYDGNVTVVNTDFTGNTVPAENGNGGAIHTGGGNITVTGGTLSGNTAPLGYGGILYAASGTVRVENAALIGGRAIAGSAILTDSGDIYVSGTLLDDCVSSDGGAPVVSVSGTVHMDVIVTTFEELYGAIRSLVPAITIANDIVLEETIYTRAPVQLTGMGDGVTLSGDGTFTLFHVDKNSITLRNLTLTGGNSAVGGHAEGDVLHGGAVCATEGSIVLEKCVVEGNSATGDGGGLYTWTTVTATDTVFRNNRAAQRGGAILAAGEVTLENCIFENNTAGWFGGAIYGYGGNVTAVNTDFTNNSATAEGGNGGAIHTDTGNITITGGTLSGNTAPLGYGGTLYSGSGTVRVENAAMIGGRAIAGSAILTDSGDIYVSGTLLDDCVSSDGGAPVVSVSGNIYMDVTVTTFAELNGAIRSQIPVIRVANDIVLEGTIYTRMPVQLIGPEDGATLSGNGTFALFHIGEQGIVLENLTLTGGNSAVGGYAEGEVLHGGAICATTGGVTLKNCVLENNSAIGDGGAIYTWTTVTATDTVFRNNHSAQQGGAILAAGEVTLENCTLEGNTASWFGGAIFTYASGVTAVKTTFRENSATAEGGNGGAIHTDTGAITLTQCVFSGNTVPLGSGGALYTGAGVITLTGDEFTENSALSGGAVAMDSGSILGTDTKFLGNRGSLGGALHAVAGKVEMTGCRFEKNLAQDSGGVIFFDHVEAPVFDQCVFAENTAANNGGAMLMLSGALHLTDSTLQNNRVEATGGSGGGVYLVSGSIEAGGTTFSGNHADSGNGGAIFLQGGQLQLTGCHLTGNSGGLGGAIFQGEGTAAFTQGCLVEDNHALLDSGGGICLLKGELSALDSVFRGNTTAMSGGAMMVNDGSLLTQNSQYEANEAGETGGAIFGYVMTTVTVDHCEFTGNTASLGGAIGVGDGVAEIGNSRFTENKARNLGGAVYAIVAETHLTDSEFLQNTAEVSGGALFAADGAKVQRIQGGSFQKNRAATDGGAVAVTTAELQVDKTQFLDNIAEKGSGGMLYSGSGSITLSGVTASGNIAGNIGGGIFADRGNVTVKSSTFRGNQARADAGGGILALHGNIVVSGGAMRENIAHTSGGALMANEGQITASSVNFYGNRAEQTGGAIFAMGNIRLTGVTMEQNVAYMGGAVGTANGKVQVEDSTFTENQANLVGGGIFCDTGSVTSTGDTYTGNQAADSGGGIYIGEGKGNLTLTECVFRSNKAYYNGAAVLGISGKLEASKCRFISNSTELGSGGGIYYLNGSVVLKGCNFTLNNAKGSAGGVYTENAGILVQEKCIFSGNAAGQMGGAIASNLGDLTAMDSTFNQNTANAAGGAISMIRGDAELSNCSCSANVAATTGGVLFSFHGHAAVKNCTMENNQAGLGGCVGDVDGDMEITGGMYSGNSSGIVGGAFYSDVGDITVTDATIIGSKAYDSGAVIYDDRGTVRMTGCRAERNSANGNGGVVALLYGDLFLDNCTFTENESGLDGGVFYGVGHNALEILNSVFTKNKAGQEGGAIFAFSGPIQLENDTFTGNSAVGSGGAVRAPYSRITASGTSFRENLSGYYGGGVYANVLELSGVQFLGNYAEVDGAAFYVTGDLVLRQVALDANQCAQGSIAFLDSLVKTDADDISAAALAAADPKEEPEPDPAPSEQEAEWDWVLLGTVAIVAAALAVVAVVIAVTLSRRRRTKARS